MCEKCGIDHPELTLQERLGLPEGETLEITMTGHPPIVSNAGGVACAVVIHPDAPEDQQLEVECRININAEGMELVIASLLHRYAEMVELPPMIAAMIVARTVEKDLMRTEYAAADGGVTVKQHRLVPLAMQKLQRLLGAGSAMGDA